MDISESTGILILPPSLVGASSAEWADFRVTKKTLRASESRIGTSLSKARPLTIYTLLKYIHILATVTTVGANLTYALWLARLAQNPDHLPFTLRTTKVMDDWIANTAYILLLPTDDAMTRLSGWALTTPWILVSLSLYAVLAMVGLALYSPTLRKQVAIVKPWTCITGIQKDGQAFNRH